ncbi:MAG TPA: GDP-L-fucose synthase [Candidatus Sphingobacterium stercoripullorum]|uniref:GDP-L-fucose synthase n=1 Tax=Candidatus Sphingobacterium stercoripullorum TaxID=2838759 RepID=A0A9D1W8B3_9SPHI|nr:GDP-L-fucose synthase [Candidatus Sphingobacterium stercoripullorum]HLR50132.1 GDP-L-fucose synthase [Candidatus Sphingobacterium stercoripullorum]
MDINSKIYIAGHNGMVGAAICRELKAQGYTNLVFRSSKELDLRSQEGVRKFFMEEKPEYVFLAAAKVGGIGANNKYRAEFLYDNLAIQNNVIHQAYAHGVEKLLFLGSSCIYPKFASQPIKEEYLLQGALEPTNEPYAIAKIAGLKMCEAYWDQYGSEFISVMPTNLYGPGDHYDLNNSHVLPALIRKFHEAKVERLTQVEVWGTGTPLREFLYVDDLASACVFLMKNYREKEFLNIGSGEEVSIGDLAALIQQVVGYSGELYFNTEKPDGTPRKLLDSSHIKSLGWSPKTSLEQGVINAYEDFKSRIESK